MSGAGGRLPYPGLRSFAREEADLFFGREGCVDDMVDRLAYSRFLAVLGASGSGKSSLVKTGLLDALEIGLLARAGSRWIVADFRPGDRPIHNLAEGLLRASAPNLADQQDGEDARFLRAFLMRGPRSVVEWCEAGNLPERTNLLLLVDQFEELLLCNTYAEREEAGAFVALLVESAKAPLSETRIYVAITMRTEYLGAAALIDGLAEAINKGLYLTPRMSRDQVRNAIVGPAAVCGFAIEPALVNRLLNDLTSFAPWEEGDTRPQLGRLARRADQLSLMQHVLNRLFVIAEERSSDGAIELKIDDYEALGGLRGALASHGREILDELLPEHREVASGVFRALSAGSSLAEAVKRPTEFAELVQITGGSEIAVREIIEAFRAPGRNFLFPPRPKPLRPTTVIDISHESLIRQWDEFAGWLQREIASAETWRQLVDAAKSYKRGEANLLSDLALASIASWWYAERPTAAWAKRHGGDYKQAADFLVESHRAEEESKRAEIEERRQKSRNRLVTLAAAIVLLVITPLMLFASYSAIRANQEADAAEVARQVAEGAREEAEQARMAVAEAERQRAKQQAAAAEAERKHRDAERERARAAQQEAEQQTAGAAEQRRLAAAARDAEGRALTAQRDATQKAELAEEQRKLAVAAQQEAVAQAAAAEAEHRRADEERQRALEARREAAQQAELAEEQRKLAVAAQQEAMAQTATAEVERKRADEERQRALEAQHEAAQQAELAEERRKLVVAAQQEAIAQTATAEAERRRADEERQRALDAERKASEQAVLAEQQRQLAVAAQQEVKKQAAAAEAERGRADQERQRALAAQAEALAQAAVAEAARREAIEQTAAAEIAREDALRSTLEQVAERILAFQQAGSWGVASHLLGALWQGVISKSGDRREDRLIEPFDCPDRRSSRHSARSLSAPESSISKALTRELPPTC